MPPESELSLWPILMGLAGGLALFLYGMEQLTDALKRVAGDGMKSLLGRLTTNRFRGVLAGATVTAVIQSSSVTTVLVVGFVSAGLMTLQQSIGVILGGGACSRLQPLTRERSKPAVPIARKLRLVDIPISNCITSGIRRVYLLTQFNSVSLHQHVHRT